jgi:uncharacterized Zn-binding protein involved in type VI secretion
VIEGSLADLCEGKAIACVGHKVYCPKCKGTYPIIEGWPLTTVYGKGVALEGMKTACGASLIATQFVTAVGGSSSGSISGDGAKLARIGADASASSLQPSFDHPDPGLTHDEQFLLKDAKGTPLRNTLYTAKLASGSTIHGMTNADGLTDRIYANAAQRIELFIGNQSALEDFE